MRNLYNPNTASEHWLMPVGDIINLFPISQIKRGFFPDIKPSRQTPDVLNLVMTFNEGLRRQCSLEAIQHYVRFADEDCYDILTVLPKAMFFSGDETGSVATLTSEFKSRGKSAGIHLAFITIPWAASIVEMNLYEEGFVLIYENKQAA